MPDWYPEAQQLLDARREIACWLDQLRRAQGEIDQLREQVTVLRQQLAARQHSKER